MQFIGRASVDGIETLTSSARLLVNDDLIHLSAFLGVYEFKAEHVSSIEVISPDQIYIRHIIQNYPALISFSSPDISQQIQELAFLPTADTGIRKKLPADDGSCNAEVVVLYSLLWFATVFCIFSQNLTLALVVNFFYGFVPLVALFTSKRWRLIMLNPGAYFVDVALPVICILVGSVLFLGGMIAAPTLCDNYEGLCKPEWSWK